MTETFATEFEEIEKMAEQKLKDEIKKDMTIDEEESKDLTLERAAKVLEPVVAIGKAAQEMPESFQNVFATGMEQISPILFGRIAADLLGSGKQMDFIDKIMAYRMLLKAEKEEEGKKSGDDSLLREVLNLFKEQIKKLEQLEKEQFTKEITDVINESLRSISEELHDLKARVSVLEDIKNNTRNDEKNES